MKRSPQRSLVPVLAFASLLAPFTATAELQAQDPQVRRAVTHDDYDSWTSMGRQTYSPDGRWLAYTIGPRVGDDTLYIQQVDGTKVYEFERGTSVSFSNDGRFAFFKLSAPYADARMKKLEELHGEKPKGKKKKTKEEKAAEKAAAARKKRVHMLDLVTGEVEQIENVKSFRQPDDSDLLLIHFDKPVAAEKDEEPKDKGEEKKGSAKEEPKKEPAEKEGGEKEAAAKGEGGQKGAKEKPKAKKKDPKEAKRKDGTRLVLRDLTTGKESEIEHVRSFGFMADDTWLYYTVGTKKMVEGVEHGLFAMELDSGRTITVLGGYSNVSSPRIDEAKTKVVFTSDLRAFGEKDAEQDIYLWDISPREARVIVDGSTRGVPNGYRVQGSGLGFSEDGTVLTMGVKPPKPEDLPKILKEDEVKLDLWHYQDGLLQTMQAKRGNPAQATLSAVYHLDADRVVVLGTETSPRVSLLTDDGSRALMADSGPYAKQVTWDGRYSDYFIVNTMNGSKTRIIEGLRGRARGSVTGRYVLWFDHRDYHWHAHDVATGESRNLTAALPVNFDRETDDRPEPHNAHGVVGWTEGDAEVLLYDSHDIWAINAGNGSFRCITEGFGRAANIQLRRSGIDLRPDAERDDNERRRFVSGELVLSATNLDTYATGYFIDSVEGMTKPRKLVMKDGALGRVTRPEDADRLFMTFSRWDVYPDVWTADLAFKNQRKLTDGCPSRDEVRWGSSELVSWRSDDGTELKGYLVKPDGFDPEKQYPMMVYFYERSSNRVHRFVSPNTGTSPNAAYYVSNGYLWFVPDIVYTDGYPGESCEKAVVSGVQHILSMGFVDRDAIGIAGHSWGGYQTAHLITRTNLFAAAESGAPVVNMFSAYGGIRWGTGMSRQFQYEQTQSRIGGTIWEYPMRYWENSPLFHLDKVETPVLILHNDRDGAVPWYQGIEFFTAMRRLDKEAYLLNYNGEDHGLRRSQNKRDWTRRMQEFFDHHLKGAPAPDWMLHGVPYHERQAEKIPNAPSFQEAVEAGLIGNQPVVEEAVGTVEATATPKAEPAGVGSGQKQ